MTRLTLAATALLAAAGPVAANAGPPYSGGQVAGEPGGIRNVQIARETLVIDLRPVADNGKAAVEATYQLHNTGPRQSLDLLFAVGSDAASDFEVLYDGRPVPASPVPGAAIPDSWKPPRQTPGLGDGRPLDYAPGMRGLYGVKPVGFSLAVEPGAHTLAVKYRVATATNRLGHPIRYHQIAYVLAPARSWDGFGGLDVTVHLPAGWEAVTSPELARDGDTLRASFPGLPADSLAVTFRAREGEWYRRLLAITQGLFAVAGFVGLVACWLVGRWRGRRAARAEAEAAPRVPRIWPWAVGVGVLWSAAFLATGFLAIFAPDAALPEGQASAYGYGEIFEAVALFILAPNVVVVGFLVAYVTGVVVRRMNRPVPAVGEPGAFPNAPTPRD